MAREYPELPVVAVGVIVLDNDHVLLIRRGRPPHAGRWSVPGGTVMLGETLRTAALRELQEETGLTAELGPIVEVLERVVPGNQPDRPQYHYIILDFLGIHPQGELHAASDAAEARWVPVAELARYDTTDGLQPVIAHAQALHLGNPAPPYHPTALVR